MAKKKRTTVKRQGKKPGGSTPESVRPSSVLASEDEIIDWEPQNSADRKFEVYSAQRLGHALRRDRTASLSPGGLRQIVEKPHVYSLDLYEWTALVRRLYQQWAVSVFSASGPDQQAAAFYSGLLTNLRKRGGRFASRADFLAAATEGPRDARRLSFEALEKDYAGEEVYWFERGMNEFRLGQLSAAQRSFTVSVELTSKTMPHIGRSVMYLAKIARWRGQTQEEIRYLTLLLEGECAEREAIDEAIKFLGTALLKVGRSEDALTLTEVWTHFPHQHVVEMCAVRAGALAQLGKRDEAVAYAEEVSGILAAGEILISPALDAVPTVRENGQADDRGSLVLSAALHHAGEEFTAEDLLGDAIARESQFSRGRGGQPHPTEVWARARIKALDLGRSDLAERFAFQQGRAALAEANEQALIETLHYLVASGAEVTGVQRLLNESRRRWPNQHMFPLQQGLADYQRGEWSTAAVRLVQAESLGSRFASVLGHLARAERDGMNSPEVIDQAVQAWKWTGQDALVPQYLMLPLLEWAERHGQMDSGIRWAAAWRPSMYFEPGDHQGYLAIELAGRCALRCGQYTAAEDWLQQAVQFRILNSNYGTELHLPLKELGRVNALLAFAMMLNGHTQEALDFLETAEQQDPDGHLQRAVRAYVQAYDGHLDAAHALILAASSPDASWMATARHLVLVFEQRGRDDLSASLQLRIDLSRDAAATVERLAASLSHSSLQVLQEEARAQRFEQMNATMLAQLFERFGPDDDLIRQLKRQVIQGTPEDVGALIEAVLAKVVNNRSLQTNRRLEKDFGPAWESLPGLVRDRIQEAQAAEVLVEQLGGQDYGLPMICIATALEHYIQSALLKPLEAAARRNGQRLSTGNSVTLGSAAYWFPSSSDSVLNQMVSPRVAALSIPFQEYLQQGWFADLSAVSKIRNAWGHGQRAVNSAEYEQTVKMVFGDQEYPGLFKVIGHLQTSPLP